MVLDVKFHSKRPWATYDGDLTAADYQSSEEAQIDVIGGSLQSAWNRAVTLQAENPSLASVPTADVAYGVWHQGVYASGTSVQGFLNSPTFTSNISATFNGTLAEVPSAIGGTNVSDQLIDDAIITQIQQSGQLAYSDANAYYQQQLQQIESSQGLSAESARNYLAGQYGVSTSSPAAGVATISDSFDLTTPAGIASAANTLTELEIPLSSTQTASSGESDTDTDANATAALNAANRQSILNQWNALLENITGPLSVSVDGITQNVTVTGSNGALTVSPDGTATLTRATSGVVYSVTTYSSAGQPLQATSFGSGGGITTQNTDAYNSDGSLSGSIFTLNSTDGNGDPEAITLAEDSSGDITSAEFAGGSVLLGPLAQQTSQVSSDALTVAIGPGGTAQIALQSGESTGSPIALSGVESMTLNLDGSYSIVDQSGTSYTLQPVSGSSNYVLGNASGTLNLTLDPNSVTGIQLGQSISLDTVAGGTISVPVFGGSGSIGLSNLDDATIAQGSAVTIGSNTIDVSAPGSGITQQYTFAPGGTVSSIATYDDSSSQTAPTTVASFNTDGEQTQLLTNNSTGGSQVVFLNAADPSAGFIVQTQNYSGLNGSGSLLNQTTDLTNGFSEIDQYNPTANAVVTRTLYSGADGTGGVISQTTNYTDGTSTVTTYSAGVGAGTSGDAVTSTTVTYPGWDGTGPAGTTTYALVQGGSQTGAQIGAAFGSQLGKLLGGNSIVESIALSTVLGTLGEDVGKAIDIANAAGVPAGDMSATIGALADSVIPDVASTGAGAVGAYLTGDLVKDLGITGLPAQLVDVGAGSAISTIASNLTEEALGSDVAWNSGLTLTSFEGSFAGFAGEEVASLVVTWSTPAEADLAAIGAAVGGAIGSAFTPIGTFIGSFIGDLVGGLIGSVILPDQDQPYAEGTFIISGNSSSPYSYQSGSVINHGPASYLSSIGNAIATEMNAIVADVGGTISNAWFVSGQNTISASGNSDLLGNLLAGEDKTGAISGPGVPGPGSRYALNFFDISDPTDLIDWTVFDQLADITFTGGDTYVEKAIDATINEFVSETDESNVLFLGTLLGPQNNSGAVTLDTLLGNIDIAKDYETYLANEATINGLIASDPTSNFAASWIVELQQVNELGLNTASIAPVNLFPSNTLNIYGAVLANQSVSDIEGLIDNPNSAFSTSTIQKYGGKSTNTISLSGDGISLELQQSNLSMATNGIENQVKIAGNENAFTMNGSSNLFSDSGNGNVAIENGDSDTLSMYGNNNSMTVNGRYASIVISGLGNTLTNANGNVTVADNSGATINGVAENISLWNGSSLLINGGQMTIDVQGANNSITANGNQEQVAVTGDGNTFTGNGQADEVSVAGTNESVTLGSGSVSLADGITVSVNGENLGIAVGNQDTLVVGGQYSGVNVSGDGDAVTINGTSMGVSGNTDTSSMTINGSSDSISVAGNNNTLTGNGTSDYLTVTGNTNNLVANGQQFTATLAGAGNTVTIANGSVVLANSATATVNGATDAVSIYNTTQVVINGGAMALEINGSQNTVTANGNNETVDSHGSNNVVTDNGSSNTINASGDSNNVIENGSNETVTVNGSYSAVQGQMGASSITINGTSGSITVVGDGNQLTENGANDYLTVTGNNNNLNANGAQITAALSGSNNTVSIGSGTVSLADNANATVDGVADSVALRNTSNVTVNGGAMALSINGSQDTITANGDANTFGTEGSSNLVVGNGSSDTFNAEGDYNNVTLNGNSEIASITGVDNVLAVNGQGNSVTFSGTNNTLHASGAIAIVLDNSTADFEGGGDSITVFNGDSAILNGSGFSITETATNSSVVANGDYDSVTIGGNHNGITVNGNGANIDLSGSINSATVSGQNAILTVSGVQQSLAVNQGNITLDAGSQASLAGNGNMVTLGTADTLAVNGSNNWVNVGANDAVTLAGTGNGVGGNATGVSVVLEGNGQYALLSNDSVTVAAGVQASVTGDQNTIVANSNAVLDLSGAGNNVQMTGATLVLDDAAVSTADGTGSSSGTGAFHIDGFDFTSYQNGEFSSATGQASMQALAATGANSVSLVVVQYVNNVSDTDIESTAATESDASLEASIADAQSKGLSILLTPHLDISDGTWRALLDPSNVPQFFANYQAMIVHYAEIAQATGVGMLSIGTEMESLSGAAYEPYWNTLIAAVRQVYSGQLTYASGWNETANVSFWNQLDVIGADAYVPVTNITDPTVAQLDAGWTTVSSNSYDASVMNNMSPVDFYQSMAATYNKPVLFTEIGYQSVNDTNELEGAFGTSNWVDFQQQSNALQSFFSTFTQNGGSWFDGAYIWNWAANPSEVEANDFSVQGKAAMDIVDTWYGAASTSGAAVTTANTLSGNSNSVTVGNGDSLILAGNSNQITLAANAAISVTGQNNTVQVVAGNDLIVTSGSTTVDVGGVNAAAIVTGDGDSLNISGSQSAVAVTGNALIASLSGVHDTLNVSGNGANVSVTGSSAIVSVSGLNNAVTVAGSGSQIQTSGATAVTFDGSATVGSVAGNGDTIAVNGTGNTVSITGSGGTVSSGSGGASITLDNGNYNVSTGSGADTLTFGNGANIVTLGGGDDSVTLGSGVDTVTLGSGQATVSLGGNDIIASGAVAGDNADESQAVINGSASGQTQTNELSFTAADSNQLWFSRSGNDLLVSVIGTSADVDISNWYSTDSNSVQLFSAADGKVLSNNQVDALVNAMASFAPPAAGATTLPDSYQSQLQPIISANWH
jgi:hypothetical protein